MTDSKTLAEAIGALLCREGKEADLKARFDSYMDIAKGSGSVAEVANYPIQRYYGRTLVHVAAFNGLPQYLDQLLKNGGNPNKPSSAPDLCQTPLHLAAHEGYSQCIEILLNHGAQIRVENTRRVTPVDLAKGKVMCERVFRNAIAKVEIPNRSQDQLQRVKNLHELLDEDGNFETFKSVYQQLALHERDLGSRWTDWFQHTLLFRAVEKQRVEAIEFLLSNSVNVPLGNLGNRSTPLLAACFNSDIKIATLLIKHSPILCFVTDEKMGLSPLHISCSRGNTPIVMAMLRVLKDDYYNTESDEESEHTLNIRDSIGRTPLFNACYHGRLEVVKGLLQFKEELPHTVDINVPEQGGRTPLHAAIASSKNSKEIVDLLLKHSELDLNVVGRASSRARKYLLKLLQRRDSSSSIPFIRFDQPGPSSSPRPLHDSPFSPPLTCSPLDTPVSDDLDTEYGVLRSKGSGDNPLFPVTPKSPVSTLTHSTTPTSPPKTTPTTTMSVYQSSSGLLQIKNNPVNTEGGGGEGEGDIQVTPLAEACIFHNDDIIDALLAHGATDSNTLATQICATIRRSELLRKILSRQCELEDEGVGLDGLHPLRHHLQWKGKHLKSVKGAWLDSEASFYTIGRGSIDGCQVIPYERVGYTGISKVTLSRNHLISVPIELFQLPNVTSIDLSYNQLKSLPEPSNGWSCDNLSMLNLSENSLTMLPSCLWALPSITMVMASDNKLEYLLTGYDPFQDGKLSKTLIEVNLSRNCLPTVTEFLFLFPRLSRINLSHNSLIFLPKAMWFLESLKDLNLSHNQLESLPLCESDEIQLSIDEDSTIMRFATPMKDLNVTLRDESINLQDTHTENLSTNKRSSKIFRIQPVANVDMIQQEATVEQSCDYSNLTTLNISHNDFICFPTGLPCLAPNLTELNISNNRIQCIDIAFLPQSLRKLIARSCMIKRVGNTLMESKLKRIHRKCFHTQDTGICLHRSHNSLQYLQTLDLLDNEIERLQLIQHTPLKRKTQDVTEDEVSYQQHITPLSLLYPSLEGLNLSRNQLRGELNPNVGQLRQLKWLRLSGNHQLERIPLEIAHLKGMRSTFTELEMRDLPNLVEPPAEYHSPHMQVGQILVYLRSKLKHSVPYRTMKLFLVGRGERGKTTLLRRLKEAGPGETERTEGIDIEFWDCRGRTGIFSGKRVPIRFLAWDFAGQDVYHVTHQLFYSRRALYLAVFRLSDGSEGIDELDPWLRNIQLRAPGCIVIVVGTHLDQVTEADKLRLEEEVMRRFLKPEYPKIVECVSVSCINRVFSNNIDTLRQTIYDVACKLKVLSKDGDSLDYRKDLKETDPHALLRQQIPASFLQLQEEIYKVYKAQPKMSDREFYQQFRNIFEDDEELNEAVHYLTLQGTLLHFEDSGLKKLYFLDPEWLSKLMARLISPQSVRNEAIVEGRISTQDLFKDGPLSSEDDEMSRSYLQLLQKFELALELNQREVLIPSLLPEEGTFPQPDESLSDVSLSVSHDHMYQPPVRRFWLSNYIPEGFWPRLICRVYKDQHISVILQKYVNSSSRKEYIEWKTWRKGMVFISRGRTLVVMRLVDNHHGDPGIDQSDRRLLIGQYRIEVFIYVPEMIRIINELEESGCGLSGNGPHGNQPIAPFDVTCDATKMMVAVSNHVVSLSTWFIGMISGDKMGYTPCWRCVGGVEKEEERGNKGMDGAGYVVNSNNMYVYSLPIEKCIIPASMGGTLPCPAHGELKVVHQAPDLVFWDLKRLSELDSPRTLKILDTDLLGKGGFGFVCKGELTCHASSQKEMVAVKVFFDALGEGHDGSPVRELVELASKPKQLLHAYKEIRQEVSFLVGLEHSNITKLYGVQTTPTLCLLLELAPKKSLRAVLKEYRERRNVLEPLTLKQCANQIAQGLGYLHNHQIVHLDMKSPNVLVWYFPSANYSKRERIEGAGNVWLKLADYGISQVSPTMLMRMGSTPIGTPGYMAPEMFESAGQEVVADKIDVFAYGMVLYELISFQVPFNKQPVHRRNTDVVDGKRPPIGTQEKHSPLCVQDLMRLCWSHDSINRPSMSQCVQWTAAADFDRLRTEITLGSCNSIACSCVSRVEPALEGEWSREGQMLTEVNGVYLTNEEVVRFGADLHLKQLSSQNSESIIEKTDTPSFTDSTEEQEDVTQPDDYKPSDHAPSPDISGRGRRRTDSIFVKSTTLDEAKSVTQKILHRRDMRGHASPASSPKREAPPTIEASYTQIWMCGRDRKKGLLAVFILPDNQKNIFRFFGYVGSEEIQVLCPIRNSVWMGTSTGSLRVLHAPTLSVKFSSRLGGAADHTPILKILHVEEEECVLVAVHSALVWCFHDTLVGQPCTLVKRQRILTDDRDDCGPVYDLVKVVIGGVAQVWGTMDNNVLLRLRMENGSWSKSYHYVTPYSHRMRACSYIVCCSFCVGVAEVWSHHLWVTYRNKSGIVCMDAESTNQIGHINCAEALQMHKDSPSHSVSTIVAEGRRLIVGTLGGTVAIFDSLTRTLLSSYRWHEEKVRSLLILPEQIKPSICAEVGVASDQSRDRDGLMRYSSYVKSSSADNKLYMPNKCSDGPLIASIGNGRRRMNVNETTPTKRRYTRGAETEDITLLLWHS